MRRFRASFRARPALSTYRGVLRPGAIADIAVFDLNAVQDVAEYTDPHHYSEGMVHVFVNGEAAVRDGAFTGARAGRVLQKGRREIS